MRTAFLITLLAARVAFAQFDDVAFVASLTPQATATVYCPTNLPQLAGYPVYAWYKADSDYYTTASGLATWVNLSSMVTNADALNLTNRASGTGAQPALQSAALDGHDALYFDGSDDYLRSVNYTSPQPHEVWMMLSVTNDGASGEIFDSIGVSGPRNLVRVDPSLGLRAYAGSFVSLTLTSFTNTWKSLTVLWSGNGSWLATNNVGISGSLGTLTGSGLTVGSSYVLNNYAMVALIEVVTFRTNLTALGRWSLNNYFRTNYPSAGIPEQSPP